MQQKYRHLCSFYSNMDRQTYHQRTVQCVTANDARSIWDYIRNKYRALLSFYARKPIEGKILRDIRLDRNGNVFNAGRGKKEGDRGTREEVRRRKRCSPMNSRASFNNT